MSSQISVRLTFKRESGEAVLEGLLDLPDLAGYHTQHFSLYPVELIKAAPRSTLHQAREDAAHGLVVQPLP